MRCSSMVCTSDCQCKFFNTPVVEYLKRLSLTLGWPEVLSMAPIVQILNKCVWPELFSLSLLRVSLAFTNEWEEAFFWPIAVSYLCCDIQTRLRQYRGGGALRLRWDFLSFYVDVFNLRSFDLSPCLGFPPSIRSHSPQCIAKQITDCYWVEESFL